MVKNALLALSSRGLLAAEPPPGEGPAAPPDGLQGRRPAANGGLSGAWLGAFLARNGWLGSGLKVTEPFRRPRKDQRLWLRSFGTFEDPSLGLQDVRDRYNRSWPMERQKHRSPPPDLSGPSGQVRMLQLKVLLLEGMFETLPLGGVARRYEHARQPPDAVVDGGRMVGHHGFLIIYGADG